MPTKTYKYNVIIGVNVGTSGLSKGSKEVEDQLSRWEKRALKAIKSIEKAMDELGKVEKKVFTDNSASGGGTSGKWTAEHKAILKATQLANRYDDQIGQLNKRQNEVGKLNRLLSQDGVAGKIDETTKSMLRQKAAIVDQIKETQRLEKEQSKLTRESSQRSRKRIESATNIGSGMQTIGVDATALVTAPVVAGLASVIKIGAEYESSMNMLQAVTSATADQMKQADDLAIKLGNDLTLPGVSAKDAAEAMTELGKAGMSVAEAMAAAKGTLQLSTAANISAAQAAEITANALNMFGLQASEAGRVADLLAGAANASSAEITDIAQSLQQAGSVFAAAKVPIEDVVALIGEMANQGIKGSDAGTSLKTMMQRLQSPTDNAAAAIKALNIQVYDQQGKMKPMRDIIGQFEKSLKGLSQQQKDQALNTIFGSDAVRAATIIFSQGTEGFDKMKEAVMRVNAAQELASARTRGLAGSWGALTSQLETVGLIIYNRIKAPLTELVIFVATVVQQITDAFVSLPDGVQSAILALTGIAAAIGPVLAVVGTLVVALGSVAGGLTALAGTATVGAALSTLAPIIAGIGVVIGILAAGIAAAVAVVYQLWQAWDAGLGPVASAVAIAVGAIIAAFVPILGLPIYIGAMLVTLYKIWTTNFAGIRDFVIVVWSKIVEIIQGAMERMTELVNAIGGRFIAWWRENYPLIQAIVQSVNDAIQNAIQGFLSWISSVWEAHGQTILKVVNFIWTNIKAFVQFGINNILDIITIVLQVLNGRWEDAWNTMLKATRRVWGFIISGIVGFNKMLADLVVNLGIWLYNNARAILTKLGSMIVSGLKYIIETIVMMPVILLKLVPTFLAAGMSIGSAIWQGIKDGLTGGGEAPAIEAFDINSIFPDFNANAVTDNEPNFIDKLKNSMNGLGDATKNTTDKASKFNKELGDLNDKSKKAEKTQKALKDLTVTSGNDSYDALYLKYAKQYKLDPNILLEQGRQESINFNAAVISGKRKSPRGAIGIAQFMPDTAAEFGVNPYSVESSIAGQAKLMRRQLNRYDGRYDLALASYNSGHNRSKEQAEYALNNFSETKKYVPTILNKAKRNSKGVTYGLGSDSEKSLDQLADESIFNDAKSRVQSLIQLSKELGVALAVPTDVTTTNDVLALQQKTELKNLQDLKKKREDIEETVSRLGLKQEDFSRADIKQADTSLTKLNAIDDAQKLVNLTYDDSVKKLQELAVTSGESLTPLEEFNIKFLDMQKASGLSREAFEKLNPKLVETRTNLQKIADTELADKVAANFKDFHETIDKEISDINAQIETVTGEANRLGMTDAQRRALDASEKQKARRRQIDDLLKSDKFKDADGATREKVTADLQNKFTAEDKLDAATKAADATKLYSDEVIRLNESLQANIELSDLQKLNIELTTGKLKDLTDEQKNQLLVLQEQADAQKAVNEQYNQTYSFIRGTLDTLTDSGTSFGDKMKSIFGGIFNSFKKMILDMTAQWLTSKLFGGSGASSGGKSSGGSGGGNIFQTILGSIFGGNRNGGNSAVGATPNFNPNIEALDFSGGTAATGSGGGGGMWGGWLDAQNMKKFFTNSSTSGASSDEESNGHPSKTSVGISIAAMAAMAIGSKMGGIAGSTLQYGGMGAMLGMQFGGPLGAAIGAAGGAIFGLISGIFGKSARRKKEEKSRETAMKDAFTALDKLVSDVNGDRIDGEQALSQADDIRKNYLDQMNQLKDKKTRTHALADVSRIDGKIAALRAAVTSQKQRKDRLISLSPTFADGGDVSRFAKKNFRNNPLGYVQGAGHSRSDSIGAYFPAANSFAQISNTEYVLDADTTRNIGVWNLDRLRAGRGKNFGDVARMMKHVHQPRIQLADGGAVVAPSVSNGSASSGGTGFELKAHTTVVINQNSDGSIAGVKSETSIDTPDGRRKLEGAVADVIYQGGKGGAIPVALNRVNK
jgi:TP901 family phage tail tape measure protein